MSRTVQGLSRLARQAILPAEEQGTAAFAQLQQRFISTERYSPRVFSKQKPVDPSSLWIGKNPYIEALYWRRDHLEREFVWNRRTTFEVTYFFGGITALMYALSIFGIRSADRQSGYPKRNFLFHESDEHNFVSPDERVFY